MGNEYLTTPWQNQSSDQQVLQELRRHGYTVEQNAGKTTIKIGDKTYNVNLSSPIWVTLAEIGKIEAENKKQEVKDDAEDNADYYHNLYVKEMDKIEHTKVQRNEYLSLWEDFKTLFRKILGKYDVRTADDIENKKDQNLANNYSNVATKYKFKWIWAGNSIISDCSDALGYALREGEWNNISALA